MSELKELLLKVAASNANVLILGESGVGKECIARMLHNYSPRKDKPYIVVDCVFIAHGVKPNPLDEIFRHIKDIGSCVVHVTNLSVGRFCVKK